MAKVSNRIEAHYLANLGIPFGDQLRNIVPAEPMLSVGIYTLPDRFALATSGLSSAKLVNPDDGHCYPSELIIYIPRDWDVESMTNGDPDWAWPVDWMRQIALGHTTRQFWFGRGDMAEDLTSCPNLQHPLAGYTACMYLTEDSSLGRIKFTEDEWTTFYTMYPLYDSEYFYLQNNTAMSLLTAFRKSGLSTIISQLRIPVA